MKYRPKLTKAASVLLTAAMALGSVNLTALPVQAAAKKPGRATVVSVTSDAKGKVTIKLKKAKGYQIVLATDKRFMKGKVTLNITKLTASTTKPRV